MTRLDAASEDHLGAVVCDGPRAVRLPARKVPLGGVRDMDVSRSLPQRDLPMVGAWCFLDRFGPQTTRMRVEPHPHIGLQTVTWPLVGEIHHRDTLGSDAVIRRGELNIMTSGRGIAHSEYSVGDDARPLDALQLWVALPEHRRHGIPAFATHADLPTLDLGDGTATVVVGELGGVRSPAEMHTPIVGAEITIPAGATVRIPLRPDWEHAIIPVVGEVRVDAGDDEPLADLDLLYLGTGRDVVVVSAASDATAFLLGGEPFPDDIVMWWNFVGRSHEEIVAAREDWEADADRFGRVAGHGTGADYMRIPAPPMPGVRLTRRHRRI